MATEKRQRPRVESKDPGALSSSGEDPDLLQRLPPAYPVTLPGFSLLSRLGYFPCWGLTPGSPRLCMCPIGALIREDRHARTVEPASCDRPGKHPAWWQLEDGRKVGALNGHLDAVPWEQWAGGLGRSASAAGGRTAAAIPGDIWVLDADSPGAWREVLQLAVTGALPRSRVLAYGRTPRGAHVWVQTEHDGWTTSTAQRALRGLGCATLEVKSRNGWMVFPCETDNPAYAEDARRWLPLSNLDAEVGHYLLLRTGWGSSKLPEFSGVVGAGIPPASRPVDTRSEAEGEPAAAPGLMTAWVELRHWCNWLARQQPGRRNNGLFRVAIREGQTAIRAGHRPDAVELVLYQAARACGLEDTETRRTIRSALRGVL